MFAVEVVPIEGRHSDQSNRDHAEHGLTGYTQVVNEQRARIKAAKLRRPRRRWISYCRNADARLPTRRLPYMDDRGLHFPAPRSGR
jgi:hypothetical protein